jgi:hypothetical protein
MKVRLMMLDGKEKDSCVFAGQWRRRTECVMGLGPLKSCNLYWHMSTAPTTRGIGNTHWVVTPQARLRLTLTAIDTWSPAPVRRGPVTRCLAIVHVQL